MIKLAKDLLNSTILLMLTVNQMVLLASSQGILSHLLSTVLCMYVLHCVYLCMCVQFVCISLSVCLYVCVCACVCVCMCVFVYVAFTLVWGLVQLLS